MTRRLFFLLLGAQLFVGGCAYQGTIVNKHVQPSPFAYSLGTDAIYKFELRDASGQVHEQMVTPALFASYSVGEYFSDLRAAPELESPAEAPEAVLPALSRRTIEERATPYRPRDWDKIAGTPASEKSSAPSARSSKKSGRAHIAASKKHRHALTAKSKVAAKHKKHSSKMARKKHFPRAQSA